MELSMIILAGGKSSRMGKDKASLALEGRTFLEWQIEKGRQLGIEDILVSGIPCALPNVRTAPDRFPGRGPLGGLEACLREIRAERALVLGVDMPLVPPEELAALIKESEASGARVTILCHGGREEPLVGVYHRSLAEDMYEELTYRKGAVFAVLNRCGCAHYESRAPEACFFNVNTPEDYASILFQKI